MNIEEIYDIFINKCNKNICTDTRNIKKNSLFFGWKGEHTDGNSFAEQALEMGCSYVVIDNEKYIKNDKYILVDDSKEMLQKLAQYHRSQFNIPIIAITGSNGKTTTKNLLASVLSTEKEVIFPIKSYNNNIGVSKTLLRINEDTEIAIIEMGANHVGEIAMLCDIVQPTHGIITNIGRAHLGLFGGFDGVVRAKTELYRYLDYHKGVSFIDGNDHLLLTQSNSDNKITYLSKDSHYPISLQKNDLFVSVLWKNKKIKSNLTGDYNIQNISAAIAVGDYFGISELSIEKGIHFYKPQNARSEVVMGKRNNVVIKDYYNANRSSVELALLNLKNLDGSKTKIVILGDMGELGDFQNEEHQAVVDVALELNLDIIILFGKVFSQINTHDEKILLFTDINELIDALNTLEVNNSIVLLKASRGPYPIPLFEKVFNNVEW